MNLFHEVENKYYELLTRLLMSNSEISDSAIAECWDKYIIGERDFEVEESLFLKSQEEATVFEYDGKRFLPTLEDPFNIRMATIELQAAKSLLMSKYAKHFLKSETQSKLVSVLKDVAEEWTISDIVVRNQYGEGAIQYEDGYEVQLSVIAEAIRQKLSIVYDNSVEGRYRFVNKELFPVRIEYSFLNDAFRVCGYDKKQNRFIKLNLSSMTNISLGEAGQEDYEDEYREFLKENTRTIVLDVEPTEHVIERCFRIFSFYDRKAIFSKEDNKYRLEISYLKFDENEVIRDVLSLGSSVVVVEPKRIQKQVYKRIVEAVNRYVM